MFYTTYFVSFFRKGDNFMIGFGDDMEGEDGLLGAMIMGGMGASAPVNTLNVQGGNQRR